MTGVVRRWAHGYGFINGIDGNTYFVHQTAVRNFSNDRALAPGTRVSFHVKPHDRGPLAVDVRVTGYSTPNREKAS
jgi:cold shock CspA family protein